MHIGVVAEGGTDHAIISRALGQLIREQGWDEGVTFVPLQPPLDATSGSYGDGGWTRVVEWCERNTPDLRAIKFEMPLFEGETPLDLLVVHLDANEANFLGGQLAPDADFNSLTSAQRVNLARSILFFLLYPSDEFIHEERHILVCPDPKIESWLFCDINKENLYEEHYEDIRLTTIEPRMKGRGAKNPINKNVKTVTLVANTCFVTFTRVSERAHSARMAERDVARFVSL